MSRKVTNKNRTRPTDIFADNILTDTQRFPYNPQTPSLCWNRCPGEPARRGLGQSSPLCFVSEIAAISEVRDGHRNRKSQNRCDFGALSHKTCSTPFACYTAAPKSLVLAWHPPRYSSMALRLRVSNKKTRVGERLRGNTNRDNRGESLREEIFLLEGLQQDLRKPPRGTLVMKTESQKGTS